MRPFPHPGRAVAGSWGRENFIQKRTPHRHDAVRERWQQGATIPLMSVQKLSVSLDERVATAAAASAQRLGLSLSAWLNDAAAQALAIEDGLAAVAEWEAEHGALTEQELAAADALLDKAEQVRRSTRVA